MNKTIIDKCNYALNHFGFDSSISRIIPNTVNVLNPSTYKGFTGITTFVKPGTHRNTMRADWHYLHIENHKNWLFLFGKVNSKRVYKWSSSPRRKPRSQKKIINKVIKELSVKVSLENNLGGGL